MPKYIGVNGVAREVTEQYIGVSNIARKITEAYIGVNGVARKYFECKPKYTSYIKEFENIVKYSNGTVSASDLEIGALCDYDGYYINNQLKSCTNLCFDLSSTASNHQSFITIAFDDLLINVGDTTRLEVTWAFDNDTSIETDSSGNSSSISVSSIVTVGYIDTADDDFYVNSSVPMASNNIEPSSEITYTYAEGYLCIGMPLAIRAAIKTNNVHTIPPYLNSLSLWYNDEQILDWR